MKTLTTHGQQMGRLQARPLEILPAIFIFRFSPLQPQVTYKSSINYLLLYCNTSHTAISRIAISNKVSANAPDKMRSKHTEMPLNDIPDVHYKARLESARMGNAILPIQVNHSCAGNNVAHI